MDVRSNMAFSGGAKVTGLPVSSANGEPVVHEQLQAAVEGLAWKDDVRCRTTANVNLAAPGATLDGLAMAVNDRFLADGQTTTQEKGIYVWNGAATPATRAADMSASAEFNSAIVPVLEGTSAGSQFRQTAVNPVVGTTAIVFTTFGNSAPAASEATAGVAEVATQGETDTGTDDTRFVTPLKMATYSGRAKRFGATFGDGSATQYDITHNLGTTDVQVQVFVVATGVTVLCDVTRTSGNVARLNFAAAPASNSLRCVVQA